MSTALLSRASGEAKNKRRWDADQSADDGARIGAAARRKEEREGAAEQAAFRQSADSDRAVTWQRVISADGEARIVQMRTDAGAYDDRGLASLSARAAREAAATASKGRLVKGGRRIGRVTLSDAELEALTAEICVMILEKRPEKRAKENRLPKAGEIAEIMATGKVAAAMESGDLQGYPADLAACRAKALDLIRAEGGRQDWRDCADAVRRASGEASDLVLNGESESRDLMAEAESHAHMDSYMLPASPARHPIAAETQATLYLTGMGKRERMAIEAALSEGRASAADMAKSCGTKTANAYRVAISKGRSLLRAAMADPAKRAALCAALQSIAEAEEGPRRESESIARLMREPAPKGPQATRLMKAAILAGSPTDAQARRMIRVYYQGSPHSTLLERLTGELRAARRAAEILCTPTIGKEGENELERAKGRIADLAQAHRAERHRTA